MPKLAPALIVVALWRLVVALPVFGADDDSFLKAALGREIIGPHAGLAEVQAYTESLVPRMPEAKTAEDWGRVADRMRTETLKRVVFRGEAAAWRDATGKVEWLGSIEGGPGYRIKKLRYEALPGLWIPALLYEPEKLAGKVPSVLNVNGHDPVGKAADYKQTRCINMARRGMLALNIEWFGMGQFKTKGFDHTLINHIDLAGSSGVATHYLAMSRAIDLLLAHEHADPERLAVTGLSGGGWQTIFISGLDTRVKLTVPVAGYSSFLTRVRHFSDLGDPEQTPCDLATVTDYAHLTAMMAPRPTLLTFNGKDDCCFRADHALPPLLDAAGPIFKLFHHEDRLRSHVNIDPGTHNYGLDNRQALYRMLGDHFFPSDSNFDAREIPCANEIKTQKELHVDLPADNADLHTLAMDLIKTLPRDAELPDGEPRVNPEEWGRARRSRLRDVTRAHEFRVVAEKVGGDSRGDLTATFWKLRMGDSWTVPVVELVRGAAPDRTVILVADEGRESASATAKAQLADGARVLAVDPFYLGESKIESHAYLFALLVAAVGDRPAGIQASQLAAMARWSRSLPGGSPATVSASGPRSSLAALIAAGLEVDAIRGLTLADSLGSLKESVEHSRDYTKAPELFCFGLLESFDIKQLAALVAPREVVFMNPSERAKAELSSLKAWYRHLGKDFDPLAASEKSR